MPETPRASELVEQLLFALANYPQAMTLVRARDHLAGSARPSNGRLAYFTVTAPDEIVRSLRGPAKDAVHEVLLVTIRRDAVERSKSLIVLPGEEGVGR